MFEERSVRFESDPKQSDRFLEVISKPDRKGDIGGSIVVCASMLLAVQSFLVAAFGIEEAKRLLSEYIADLGRKMN